MPALSARRAWEAGAARLPSEGPRNWGLTLESWSMPWIRIPGLQGLVYEPDHAGRPARKHRCADCFRCQMCADARCAACLSRRRRRRPAPRRGAAAPADPS